MKRLIVALVILVVVIVTVGFLRRDAMASTLSYRFVVVDKGDVESTVSATGTLNAITTVQVGTQVSGQIAELHADFNDHVKKGQLVAQLDPKEEQLEVQQAEAAEEQAQATYAQQAFLLDQTKKLVKSLVLTETDLQNAQASYGVADANLKAAKTSLQKAQQDLNYTQIYAPIDGIVVQRSVDVGQTVASSFSAPQLYLIAADLKKMQIVVSVDEADIGQIHDGQKVQFTVQAYPNQTFIGTVAQIRLGSSTVDNVVDYPVVVNLSNPDGKLLPGMTATVDFELAKATNVFRVPDAALRFRPTPDMLAASGTRDSSSSEGGARRAPQAGRSGGSNRSASNAAAAVTRPGTMATLWYLDAQRHPAMLRIRTGIGDGHETEISGPDIKAGMQIIAAVTGGSAASSAPQNPFQSNQSGGRGGFRGGF